jgi:hypothetical protein
MNQVGLSPPQLGLVLVDALLCLEWFVGLGLTIFFKKKIIVRNPNSFIRYNLRIQKEREEKKKNLFIYFF